MRLEQQLKQLESIKPRPEFKERVDIWSDQLEADVGVGVWGYLLRPAILGLGLVFFLGTGTALATYTSQPGSLLYPVKETVANFLARDEKNGLEEREEIEALDQENEATVSATLQPILPPSPSVQPLTNQPQEEARDRVDLSEPIDEKVEETTDEVLDTVDEVIENTTDTIDKVLGIQSPQESDQNETDKSQKQDEPVIEVDTNLLNPEGGDELDVKLKLSL